MVAELERVLSSEGYAVWWDRNITPGQDIRNEIDNQLLVADLSSFGRSSLFPQNG